eukprot:2573469-Rhodomonas_salina.1
MARAVLSGRLGPVLGNLGTSCKAPLRPEKGALAAHDDHGLGGNNSLFLGGHARRVQGAYSYPPFSRLNHIEAALSSAQRAPEESG